MKTFEINESIIRQILQEPSGKILEQIEEEKNDYIVILFSDISQDWSNPGVWFDKLTRAEADKTFEYYKAILGTAEAAFCQAVEMHKADNPNETDDKTFIKGAWLIDGEIRGYEEGYK